MRMSERQLDIPGIGQQKAKLSDWKKENKVFTHHAPHMADCNPWCAWNEILSPDDYLNRYGGEAFGYGKSEKSAILDLCDKDDDIKLPFWW